MNRLFFLDPQGAFGPVEGPPGPPGQVQDLRGHLQDVQEELQDHFQEGFRWILRGLKEVVRSCSRASGAPEKLETSNGSFQLQIQ